MLPTNIDLTEHQDFGSGSLFNSNSWFDIPIGIIDDDIMSSDEYEIYSRHIELFGRTRHSNQARDVFGVLYDMPKKDYVYWKRTCCRCGKRLYPWSNLGGICCECNRDWNNSSSGRIPWKTYNSRFSNSVRDIFSLR